MELEQFIKNTLLDITRGIKGVNSELEGVTTFHIVANDEISFDIAVTITEEATAEGGGKINIYAAKFGAGGQLSSSNENVSKIKFKIKTSTPLR